MTGTVVDNSVACLVQDLNSMYSIRNTNLVYLLCLRTGGLTASDGKYKLTSLSDEPGVLVRNPWFQ